MCSLTARLKRPISGNVAQKEMEAPLNASLVFGSTHGNLWAPIREKIASPLGPALGQPLSYDSTKGIQRNRLRLAEQIELRRSNHIRFG